MACGWSQQLLFGLSAPLRIPAAGNVFAFYVLGLPLGAFLAYHRGMGARGTWAGLVVAVGAIVLVQYTFLYFTVDWAAAAKRARERALQRDRSAPQAAVEEHDEGLESSGRGLAAADSAKQVEMTLTPAAAE